MEKDQYQPTGKWEFDKGVTEVFDDMLRRSIPQYDVMRRACFDVACEFVTPSTTILDLGCSRGEAIAPLVEKFGAYNRFVGVEVSKPMREAFAERFAGLIKVGIVSLRDDDLRVKYPPVSASVTLCVLTLQFIPIEYRHAVVSNIYSHTVPGGAVILVEKVLGRSVKTDSILTKTYHNLKRDNGYTQDDIDRKRLSLEGVLVPVTDRWNEELLTSSGFTDVECFWRWMNFASWVGVKR